MLGRGIVTAGIPWIAAQQSFDAEPAPFNHTMFRQAFTGVMRAGWGKSACWRAKWTDHVLIPMYQLDYNSAHLRSTLLNSIFKLSSCEPRLCGQVRFTITTKSKLHSLMLCWRNASLMVLFKQF